MLITMLADRFDAGGVLRASGTQVDVPTDLALRWIGDNAARPVGNSRETSQNFLKEVPVVQDILSGAQRAGGSPVSGAGKTPILNAASAGQDSGWVPISAAIMKINYQLDSGSTTTGFAIDVSADQSTSLGQAFTGTWASSTTAESAYLPFSNPLAKYFRVTVTSGGPISMSIN